MTEGQHVLENAGLTGSEQAHKLVSILGEKRFSEKETNLLLQPPPLGSTVQGQHMSDSGVRNEHYDVRVQGIQYVFKSHPLKA
jgi:hypothetical protein